MTLKQFYEQTKDLNQETLIVVSSDIEGNSFSKMKDFTENMIYYDGEVFDQEDLEEDGGETIMEHGRECIVIWPV